MELSDYQRDILIRTALGEAAGEGQGGMEAVLHVILNRANSGDYSSDPAKVALQKNQFSAWNDTSNGGNDPSKWKEGSKSYKTAAAALDAVLGGNPDPTGGALFYHADSMTPGWADGNGNDIKYSDVVDIGNHRFYASHPVPPGNIPSVASATDIPPNPPRPMPARPFGNSRPTDRLDSLLPDQAMFGVRPGGPGPDAMTPDTSIFAAGDMSDDLQRWPGGPASYRDALATALLPRVPAPPQGPNGRRPPPPAPVAPPSLNETRREQNTTYRPPAPAVVAPPLLPRPRPDPPLGFDPLPAPAPLMPRQSAAPPMPRIRPQLPPPVVVPASMGAGTRDTSQPLAYPGSQEPPTVSIGPTPPSPFAPPPPSAPNIDAAQTEADRLRLSGYRAIQEMGPMLPPGGGSVPRLTAPSTGGLASHPVTTIAMGPDNQPILSPGPRITPPMPLTPSSLLRASPPPPMPFRSRPLTPYMTSPSYMTTPRAPANGISPAASPAQQAAAQQSWDRYLNRKRQIAEGRASQLDEFGMIR